MKSVGSLTLLIALASPVSAIVTIDYVSVGDAGNMADIPGYGGYGAVAYEYQIGKYEVTNAQYTAFLNAKGQSNANTIYNTNMVGGGDGITRSGSFGSYSYSVAGFANRPVQYVSWYSAARFTNWMGNGQGSGDTETGSYTLSGNTGVITKNVGASVWIPSENEWYKAAYYNGATSSYSLYPNGQNSITTADANYDSSAPTDVGTYSGDPSYYGTFDQGGNVSEWNDAVLYGTQRGIRGSNFGYGEYQMRSFVRGDYDPKRGESFIGFRVATIAIPEPTSIFLTMFAGGIMLIRRKR